MNWTAQPRYHIHDHSDVLEEEKGTKIQSAPGLIGNRWLKNALSIETGHHHSGSGEKAFGGVKQWPHLYLSVDFKTGEENLRDKLAEKLKQVLEEFFQDLRDDSYCECGGAWKIDGAHSNQYCSLCFKPKPK